MTTAFDQALADLKRVVGDGGAHLTVESAEGERAPVDRAVVSKRAAETLTRVLRSIGGSTEADAPPPAPPHSQ